MPLLTHFRDKKIPAYTKEFVDSVFRWVSYNAATAFVIRYALHLLESKANAIQIGFVTILLLVLFDMTASYGISQIVDPILQRHGLSREKMRWLHLSCYAVIFLAIQQTLWQMFSTLKV